MRKSRLKILPARSLLHLGFLLLYLSCPTIGEMFRVQPDYGFKSFDQPELMCYTRLSESEEGLSILHLDDFREMNRTDKDNGIDYFYGMTYMNGTDSDAGKGPTTVVVLNGASFPYILESTENSEKCEIENYKQPDSTPPKNFKIRSLNPRKTFESSEKTVNSLSGKRSATRKPQSLWLRNAKLDSTVNVSTKKQNSESSMTRSLKQKRQERGSDMNPSRRTLTRLYSTRSRDGSSDNRLLRDSVRKIHNERAAETRNTLSITAEGRIVLEKPTQSRRTVDDSTAPRRTSTERSGTNRASQERRMSERSISKNFPSRRTSPEIKDIRRFNGSPERRNSGERRITNNNVRLSRETNTQTRRGSTERINERRQSPDLKDTRRERSSLQRVSSERMKDRRVLNERVITRRNPDDTRTSSEIRAIGHESESNQIKSLNIQSMFSERRNTRRSSDERLGDRRSRSLPNMRAVSNQNRRVSPVQTFSIIDPKKNLQERRSDRRVSTERLDTQETIHKSETNIKNKKFANERSRSTTTRRINTRSVEMIRESRRTIREGTTARRILSERTVSQTNSRERDTRLSPRRIISAVPHQYAEMSRESRRTKNEGATTRRVLTERTESQRISRERDMRLSLRPTISHQAAETPRESRRTTNERTTTRRILTERAASQRISRERDMRLSPRPAVFHQDAETSRESRRTTNERTTTRRISTERSHQAAETSRESRRTTNERTPTRRISTERIGSQRISSERDTRLSPRSAVSHQAAATSRESRRTTNERTTTRRISTERIGSQRISSERDTHLSPRSAFSHQAAATSRESRRTTNERTTTRRISIERIGSQRISHERDTRLSSRPAVSHQTAEKSRESRRTTNERTTTRRISTERIGSQRISSERDTHLSPRSAVSHQAAATSRESRRTTNERTTTRRISIERIGSQRISHERDTRLSSRPAVSHQTAEKSRESRRTTNERTTTRRISTERIGSQRISSERDIRLSPRSAVPHHDVASRKISRERNTRISSKRLIPAVPHQSAEMSRESRQIANERAARRTVEMSRTTKGMVTVSRVLSEPMASQGTSKDLRLSRGTHPCHKQIIPKTSRQVAHLTAESRRLSNERIATGRETVERTQLQRMRPRALSAVYRTSSDERKLQERVAYTFRQRATGRSVESTRTTGRSTLSRNVLPNLILLRRTSPEQRIMENRISTNQERQESVMAHRNTERSAGSRHNRNISYHGSAQRTNFQRMFYKRAEVQRLFSHADHRANRKILSTQVTAYNRNSFMHPVDKLHKSDISKQSSVSPNSLPFQILNKYDSKQSSGLYLKLTAVFLGLAKQLILLLVITVPLKNDKLWHFGSFLKVVNDPIKTQNPKILDRVPASEEVEARTALKDNIRQGSANKHFFCKILEGTSVNWLLPSIRI